MSNFFRNDLNLGKKWGHRFLIVIFFLGLIISIISAFTSTLIHPSYIIGKQIATLNSRLTSDLIVASNLVKPGEIAGNSSFLPTTYGEAGFWDNWSSETYCSKELDKHISEIQKITGVYALYNANGVKVNSSKAFSESLEESNSFCIIIDNFQDGKKFLRPRPMMNDYSFYKPSFLENIKYNLSTIGSHLTITLISVLILLVIYYKIILYVIYGKNKKKK